MYKFVIGGAIIFAAIFAGILISGSNNQRYKNRRMKYTCGIEGGCEMTINGTYDTKQKCEEECGWKNK